MQERVALRLGLLVAVAEAVLLGFLGTLHFGLVLQFGAAAYAAPFVYPVAMVETTLAIAIWVSVFWPGSLRTRAGRALGTQSLVLLGIVAVHVGLMRAASLTTARIEVVYVAIFVLAILGIVLLASPMITAATQKPRARGTLS